MRKIEEIYQKKTPHEHILHSPDTYIGDIEKKVSNMWIYNKKNKAPFIVNKEIEYVPGLYKIFDEILVNAADHTIRCDTCNTIKITIEDDRITIWNNGSGIDVVEHKEHKILVPSLIFGEILTSTNYDKEEEKIVGGKNGYGAKLTNIYSVLFEVETIDEKRHKKFYQKFSDNMYTKEKPIVRSFQKKPYTQISFIPDYEKFGLKGLTNDIILLFKKRCYDVAMKGIKVYFNNELIKSNTFQKYINLYFPENGEHKKVIDMSNERWKIGVIYDPTDTLDHQNISFVNSINTSRGGTHVDNIMNQIINKLKIAINKKHKNLQLKPNQIKENIILFIDSTIVNPSFDTQTKECLTTNNTKFGSKYVINDDLIKKIIKTGIVQRIIANAKAKLDIDLLKSSEKRNKVKYEKLSAAKFANKKNGHKCSLFLTEGDSAKGFAEAGLNIIGRDYYGVFPLKGKLKNVRNETVDKIILNKEITAIRSIIGLQYGQKYNKLEGLNYGSIIILTDQDADGFHIKGLLINFIYKFWPSLTKYKGFIRTLATPLIKAIKGKETMNFYNENEFNEFIDEHPNWKHKYFKGLGTHDKKESQNCFKDMKEQLISYTWDKNKHPEDLCYQPKEKDLNKDAIILAFDEKRADDRKLWLNTFNGQYLDNSKKEVTYYEFIHNELLEFSVLNAARAIPHIMDGWKPSQRKAFCGSMKENIYKKEIKVAQLTGSISKSMEYHHGEQSMSETIVGMAQNFVGSNNINIFVPNGNFGSRTKGGKDAASDRYIYTQLNLLMKNIFNESDENILKKQYEDNNLIEPEFYVPIIPMILINGSIGIGTGYSTNIPSCNIYDIYEAITSILKNKKIKPINVFYRYYTGEIKRIDDKTFNIYANYKIKGDKLIITDLPIGVWVENYKKFLNESLDSKKKNIITQNIKSYKEFCTDVKIYFEIIFYPGKLQKCMKNELALRQLKLIKKVSITNMHLFDINGKIKKYETLEDILYEFVDNRLIYYEKRRRYLLKHLKKEIEFLSFKMKFIRLVIDEKIIVFRNGKTKNKRQLIEQIEKYEFPKIHDNYNYLIEIPIYHFTTDKVNELQNLIDEKQKEIDRLNDINAKNMWIEDLDEFIEIYKRWEEEQYNIYSSLLPS